jgi:ABC-type Mn2+/Zn2+ transport system ATPase subunit
MNTVLQVKDLTARYQDVTENAIESISFELQKGTFTAILGPNGSGKSTIIKAILGFVPSSGSVKLYGKNIMANLKEIGYVPQKFHIEDNIPITVEEFLSLTLDKKFQVKEIDDALNLVDLLSSKKRNLSSLSGGQLQRVLIARALIRKPSILILDEPEAGIDVSAGEKFYTLLKNLVKKEGLTVLMATHEIEVMRNFSDQILCVNKRLLCKLKPKDTLTTDIMKKMYSGEINLNSHKHN